jgi:hypothetical protein
MAMWWPMICSITLLEESWEESNPTDVVIIMSDNRAEPSSSHASHAKLVNGCNFVSLAVRNL